MGRPPDVRVQLDIARDPKEVRSWWLDLPDDYTATDPREQPHRIITLKRDGHKRELLTFWRGPMGRELQVPEVLMEGKDGWAFDITLPFGLAQRDEFRLTATPEGTRVDIDVWIWARTGAGRLALPAFKAYARKNYPRMWKGAGRLCEKATTR